MKPYQQQYIENTKEIIALSDFCRGIGEPFPLWYESRRRAEERSAALRRENIRLLEEELFPCLDTLHTAPEEELDELAAFADVLMDWKSNLDCGLYVLIHDALLSLCRTRGDRDGVIRELYKLGMGMFYQNRGIQGMSDERSQAFYFENELVFTEAGSYLKYFDRIASSETRGYIVRALANIAICSPDKKKRVAVTGRVIALTQDPYYTEQAPELPWKTYLSRAYQQMSSNRSVLSKGDLTAKELAAILEACQIVFEPETAGENPNVRWLWPYYEMEYSCGFADLDKTLNRMEVLIDEDGGDAYDVSGLYRNLQLPLYYGKLIAENPGLQSLPRRMAFARKAYRKMMHTFMNFPADRIDELFVYYIILTFDSYQELPGCESYRTVTGRLMERFAGEQYVRSRKVSELLKVLSLAIVKSDTGFFDDIPFLAALKDPEEKLKAVAAYADACGVYHDFGLIRMNMNKLLRTRNLLEREDKIYQQHTLIGHYDLDRKTSTKIFADIALGHHRWYDGSGGYPEEYQRAASPYRQMTDACAVAVFLAENWAGDADALFAEVIAGGGTRFSPLVTAVLDDRQVRAELTALLSDDGRRSYRELYNHLTHLP